MLGKSIIKALVPLVLLAAPLACATVPAHAGDVSTCELANHPERYAGQEIVVSGIYENEHIFDETCGRGVDLNLENTEDSPVLAEMHKADRETAITRDPTKKIVPAARFRAKILGTYQPDEYQVTTGKIYVKRILSAKRLR